MLGARGERVLEIAPQRLQRGAARRAGRHPSAVTTIDIDAELVAAARRHLTTAGYAQVRTIVADGAAASGGGPVRRDRRDRWRRADPAAWIDSARGGRLVAP